MVSLKGIFTVELAQFIMYVCKCHDTVCPLTLERRKRRYGGNLHRRGYKGEGLKYIKITLKVDFNIYKKKSGSGPHRIFQMETR